MEDALLRRRVYLVFHSHSHFPLHILRPPDSCLAYTHPSRTRHGKLQVTHLGPDPVEQLHCRAHARG